MTVARSLNVALVYAIVEPLKLIVYTELKDMSKAFATEKGVVEGAIADRGGGFVCNA